MYLNLTPPTPYYLGDCSALSGTTWVATIVGTLTAPVRVILIDTTCDQDLEFGYTAGTGATAAFYLLYLGGSRFQAVDLPNDRKLIGTLYVRKRAGGTTPTASTKLAIGAMG